MKEKERQQTGIVEELPYKKKMSEYEIEELRKQRSAQLEERQRKIYDRAVKYAERYGEDDFRTEMMLIFLEVSDTIQEVIDMQDAFIDVQQFFTDAINVLDDNLNLNQSLIQSQLGTDYGFFARLKRKREIKRAAKNNAHRIQMLVYSIEGVIDNANYMSEAMRGMMYTVKGKMEASKRKSMKLDTKNKGGNTESNSTKLSKYAQRFGDVKNVENLGKKDTDNNSKPSGSDDSIDDIA